MPFFGVPIRNGLPIGLGSVAGFGVQQFDPSQLFEGGTVAGAWYDPSDLSTMFTTDAGTTPVAMPGGGAAVSVGRILDKSGNGNHAIAFNNTTARPELRARVNLLTYSEDFSNAAWLTFGGASKISANAIRLTSADIASNVYQQFTAAETNASSYVFSVEVKRNAATNQTFQLFQNIRGVIPFGRSGDLVATDEWQRFTLTHTSAGGSIGSVFGIIGNTAGTQADLLVRNADLRPANIGANVPAYQRIADANTYDTNGFPLYLRFDGIDDSMYTPANLNLSGTDKVAVFAGVRKLSDAAIGQIAELSIEATPNAGTFIMRAPQGALAANYAFFHRGSITLADATTPSSYAAPITNVLSGLSNLGGPSVSIRVNGAQAASSTGVVGAGNYGSYPLFIGARNNSGLRLNGQIYSLIIAGSAVSAGNISATEQWVAGKTGIQI